MKRNRYCKVCGARLQAHNQHPVCSKCRKAWKWKCTICGMTKRNAQCYYCKVRDSPEDGPAHKPQTPTAGPPGSHERIMAYRERFATDEELHHPNDATYEEWTGPVNRQLYDQRYKRRPRGKHGHRK